MKSSKFYALLALLMMAGGLKAQNTCWDGSVAETYNGGNGTPESPYQIATAAQLALLAQQTNNGTGGDAYYVLTDNICLNDNLNVNPLNWTPIGCVVDSVPAFFTGHFDGCKMTVSGLYFDDLSNSEVVGLFGCTNGAEILNVSLSGCNVTGSRYAGGLVGHAGLTDISGCHVDNTSITCEARAAGGLVGFLGLPYGVSQNSYDTCYIDDCHMNENVTVFGKLAGGLAGEITEYLLWGPSVPSVLSNCMSNAVIMGTESVGGLVGFMRNGKVESCRCWNEVHSGQYAGGMVGVGVNVNFTNCQNGVYVTGNYHCGGMAGKLYGGNLTNCENYGRIQGSGASSISEIGGMIGMFKPDPLLSGSPCENFIRNCHNYGDITYSGDDAGGIVGYAEGGVSIEKLFIVDCSNSGMVFDNAGIAGGILGSSNGYVMRILNVYNTASIGARYGVGGIVSELSLSEDRVINAYNTGELVHEIENYVCPRGAIVGNSFGHSFTNEQFSSCYWLANDEYGSNGQGPELENSSTFLPTASASVWQLETPVHNTDDLLTALNLGAEEIDFPNLGEVSRWHEDFDMENGGFPMFGIYDAIEESSTVLSGMAYPNPGRSTLNIQTALQNARVEIYDLTGRLVYRQETTGNITSINTKDWSDGVYLWKVISNGKEAESGKWIKQ